MVLVIHDGVSILTWLVGCRLSEAKTHISNGYPHLLEGWEAGTITAQEINVVDEELYDHSNFEVVDGEVVHK